MSGERFLIHQVVGTCFSFYSDEDIRKISVKRVTSAVAFDGMQHPIQGYVAVSMTAPCHCAQCSVLCAALVHVW